VPAELLAQPGKFVVHGRITALDGAYSDDYTTITVTDVAPTVSVESNRRSPPARPSRLTV